MSSATNYYKATVGSVAAHTLAQEVFPFSDEDPVEARGALAWARARFPANPNDPPVISVWRRSAVVPSYIPEIGWSVGGKIESAGVVDLSEMAAE